MDILKILINSKKEYQFLDNSSEEYFKREIENLILAEQNHKCHLCKNLISQNQQIHLIRYPRKHQLPDYPTNIIAICPRCYHDLLNHTLFGVHEHSKEKTWIDQSPQNYPII